jgi:hypothetical protein
VASSPPPVSLRAMHSSYRAAKMLSEAFESGKKLLGEISEGVFGESSEEGSKEATKEGTEVRRRRNRGLLT